MLDFPYSQSSTPGSDYEKLLLEMVDTLRTGSHRLVLRADNHEHSNNEESFKDLESASS